ncbi:hypothetical protein NKH77_18685 [Streptomyces sp. M19]
MSGRGVRTLAFTTYGPLLTEPGAFRSGASRGPPPAGWPPPTSRG